MLGAAPEMGLVAIPKRNHAKALGNHSTNNPEYICHVILPLSLSLSLYIYIYYIIYIIYMIYIYTPVISVISAIYQLYKFSHPREVAQVTNIKVGCPHPCSEAPGRDSFLRFLAKNGVFFHGKIICQSMVTNDLPSGKHTKTVENHHF